MLPVTKTLDAMITWTERRAARLLFSGAGLYFTLALLANLGEDTTLITNAAFAMTASLGALCFSYARALATGDEVRSSVVHAGERFFHAALLLITASLIKYVALRVVNLEPDLPSSTAFATIGAQAFGFVAMLLFLRALVFADTGVSQITRVLWERPRRRLWEVDSP